MRFDKDYHDPGCRRGQNAELRLACNLGNALADVPCAFHPHQGRALRGPSGIASALNSMRLMVTA
jgi:hypothetical protein